MTVPRVYKKVYAIIFILALTGLVVRYLNYPDIDPWFHVRTFFLSLVFISAIYEFHRWLTATLNKYLPFDKGEAKRIIVQIALGTLFLMAIWSAIYFNAPEKLPIKIDPLAQKMTIVIYIILSFAVNLGFIADHFFRNWKAQISLSERLQKEKAQVQYDNLKNQLNPHFLFNALTSLDSLIYENQDLASEFLQHLSKIYRYLLQNNENELVTLSREYDFIQNYTFLLTTRFEKSLKLDFKLREEDMHKQIVPVTLQILIENAIKHNIASPEKPLSITVVSDGEYLSVCNNLQKRQVVENSNKIGLLRLSALYEFLSVRKLEVEETQNEFVVKIPLL